MLISYQLNIQLPKSLNNDVVIEIFSLNGSLLSSTSTQAQGQVVKVDMAHMQKGMYLVKINDGKSQYSKKIVKE